MLNKADWVFILSSIQSAVAKQSRKPKVFRNSRFYLEGPLFEQTLKYSWKSDAATCELPVVFANKGFHNRKFQRKILFSQFIFWTSFQIKCHLRNDVCTVPAFHHGNPGKCSHLTRNLAEFVSYRIALFCRLFVGFLGKIIRNPSFGKLWGFKIAWSIHFPLLNFHFSTN